MAHQGEEGALLLNVQYNQRTVQIVLTKKWKVMTIFGTRPEAIKMAPLVLELQKHPEQVESIVTVTAQHRQMLDQVLETFKITPDYDLNIMKDRQTLIDVTTNALQGLDKVMKEAQPDIVLVHGDTATTFIASLAAFYNQIAIGHVEAGLRTWNKYSPYPEEMNRQLTGVMADLHFAPTEVSKKNLLDENKNPNTIYVTGNTAIDALATTVSEHYTHPVLEKIANDRMILLTAHRRENLGEPMRHMFRAITRLLAEHEDVQVVYPVHMNPAVREIANEILGDNKRVHLIEPLEVFDFHNFAANSYMILTDSGGVQEEAPSLGKPVLVLRDTTERPEGIAAGTLKLAGTEEEMIYSLAKELLEDKEAYEAMAKASNPYGDGHASQRIVKALLDFLQKSK
ncbi:UDP-N-acetylglucosamine 2-epimerase [Lysinibacillus sphaericus]|uniref:UDP-N-acetylglucosamine 2-epimerase (non-hydrolyzing) n=1 Tax=Lysinibacillus sphaericus TaxID=1421 RepID=A0A2S5D560_LYSSH|nr:UDP-N-acetylglucosamine 2-epimerase [Lysinibacillus sphaericus]